ncbi:Clp protease-domain-containing protein [Bombardia bombarda]|uniref:ATP-dependent Clp protease proteolytic subunit n=1 Tax=Bombardia bombarda TaxID=252184 RepID=A0AA40CGE2_9PEZI|nr:Clp protease-domain-containing protein [Bombardia bombarda]
MNSRRAALRIIGAGSAPPCRRFSQFNAFPGFPGSERPTGAGIPMPYITEVTAGGWRTSDIFSKLLQERIICLNGAIDDTVSAAIVAQLLWLESDNPDKPITMYINSPGGEVSSGLAIYDTMTYIKSPVSTVCVGMAASMAAILLLGGEAGKRYALPHSSIMVHQPLGGTRGQASDILIYANQIQRLREQVNKIVQTHLNKSFGHEKYDLQAVNDMMERDKYLTGDEAVTYGIVDEILHRRAKEDSNTKPGAVAAEAGSPKP